MVLLVRLLWLCASGSGYIILSGSHLFGDNVFLAFYVVCDYCTFHLSDLESVFVHIV